MNLGNLMTLLSVLAVVGLIAFELLAGPEAVMVVHGFLAVVAVAVCLIGLVKMIREGIQ